MKLPQMINEIRDELQYSSYDIFSNDMSVENLTSGIIPVRYRDESNQEIAFNFTLGETLTNTFRYVGMEMVDETTITPKDMSKVMDAIRRLERITAKQ